MFYRYDTATPSVAASRTLRAEYEEDRARQRTMMPPPNRNLAWWIRGVVGATAGVAAGISATWALTEGMHYARTEGAIITASAAAKSSPVDIAAMIRFRDGVIGPNITAGITVTAFATLCCIHMFMANVEARYTEDAPHLLAEIFPDSIEY